MLKKPIVSLFHSLKSKNRYYWVPPKTEELNNISLIKQKYKIPKDVLAHMEDQEQNIKQLTNELTNQKKVFENIYSNVQYIYDIHFVQVLILFNACLILFNSCLILFSKH